MNILVRADASIQIGAGHVMRCLALAQALRNEGATVCFALAHTTPVIEARLGSEGFRSISLISASGSSEDAIETISIAQEVHADWIVADGYCFGVDYQRAIKGAGFRMLLVDDYSHADHYYADLVLNQNAYAQERMYRKREARTELLLGQRYALLRQEFLKWSGWERQIAQQGHKVLVTLGGTDPQNVTETVVAALTSNPGDNLEVIVVMGGRSSIDSSGLPPSSNGANIRYLHNADNMAELMAWADIAVSAAGSTALELAFMGLPSLLIICADNQEIVAETLDELKIAASLGLAHDLTHWAIRSAVIELAQNHEKRLAMSRIARYRVDGKGCSRVVRKMKLFDIRIRFANEADCRMIWEWANDPIARENSFTPAAIPWDVHQQWFRAKLESIKCAIYIAEDRSKSPIGYVRFNIHESNATISICIDTKFRGRGYASMLIELACSKLLHTNKIDTIDAYAKPTNIASIRAFEKVGFTSLEDCEFGNCMARHLIITKLGFIRR